MFECFISYSNKDRQEVHTILDILRVAFGEQVRFWEFEDQVKFASHIHKEIKQAISRSNMVILFASKEAALTPEVRKECSIAKQHGKTVLLIKIKEIDDRSLDLFCKDIGQYRYIDLSGIKGVKEIRNVIKTIKEVYHATMLGEIAVIESTEELVRDIVQTTGSELAFHLVDGGTTLRKLLGNAGLQELMASKDQLTIKFLYLDTGFKEFIHDAVATRNQPKLGELPSEVYCSLYESLLQASMVIHNKGPHDDDVRDVLGFLEELAHKNPKITINVRKTSQLPVFRMIINENYLYRTHFMLNPAGFERNVPDYYSLKLRCDTEMYKINKKYFSKLYDQSEIVK